MIARTRGRLLPFGCLLALSAAAHPAPAPAPAPVPATAASSPESEADERQVRISAADAAHMGIAVAQASPAHYTPETQGYGVIVAHDAIAQAVAEAGSAAAMARQSQAALARIEQLAGTPGAETIQAREAAQRQADSDQIARTLAQRRLSALLGQHPPWGADGTPAILQAVASGERKLLRVVFPLGAAGGAAPHELRLARLDGPSAGQQWHTRTIWPAPADTTIVGRSYFALLPVTDLQEGERLAAWATDPTASALAGAWIPASAAVAAEGRYWCYVQEKPGSFTRTPLDITRPLRDGYFVQDPAPGETVVTAGAGLLLARELNPDSGADD